MTTSKTLPHRRREISNTSRATLADVQATVKAKNETAQARKEDQEMKPEFVRQVYGAIKAAIPLFPEATPDRAVIDDEIDIVSGALGVRLGNRRLGNGGPK